MTPRVGVKGQVVIPKAIRDEIGIRPGDEVTLEADGVELRTTRRSAPRTSRDCAGSGRTPKAAAPTSCWRRVAGSVSWRSTRPRGRTLVVLDS
jgi:AbrB family looped-hinge helix DNA binding protein